MNEPRTPTSSTRSWMTNVGWFALGIFALVVVFRYVRHGWGAMSTSLLMDASIAAVGGVFLVARVWLMRRVPAPVGYQPWSTRRAVAITAAASTVGGLVTVLVLLGFPGRHTMLTNFRFLGGGLLALGILTIAILIRNCGWRTVLHDLVAHEDLRPPSETRLSRPMEQESPVVLFGVMLAGLALVVAGAWSLFLNPSQPLDETSMPRTLLMTGVALLGVGLWVWWKSRHLDITKTSPTR